ncbi:hypothetical protein TARUN_5854 [Trichoderma arundinaceum]|uniref:Helicase required for RNAi-mediated heterochromatin assembly 1 n=1 Tax=Trichoderma arundinaceum TaxID=490622 RepID=A0A395NJX0_TRIAR|nr:hypothetical protein TARUN_5854 [Trichoderma arundinaceum]
MNSDNYQKHVPLSEGHNLPKYVTHWIGSHEDFESEVLSGPSDLGDEEKPAQAPVYEPLPPSDFLELPAASKISLHVRSGQLDHKFSDDSREEWRSQPEIPHSQELMARHPPIPPQNPVDTLPPSKLEYLAAHYQLNRYEAVEPLRDIVMRFRSKPNAKEAATACIYTNVRPTGYLLSRLGACCRVTFSTERSPVPIDWRVSNRLTPGTLVALSPSSDCFRRICIVATVATRSFNGRAKPTEDNPESPPQIELFWANPDEAVIDVAADLVMLEANIGYFESVRYTMVGLQHAAVYQTSLDKYVVECPPSVGSARYLAGIQRVAPEKASLLDDSQQKAFTAMTTQEFSVIQGPPGTGKTYTSIVAIQSYVETLKKCQRSRPAPIILAAQTNHALDQLLELCIQSRVGKIVRLGGQSNSPIVRQESLSNLRSSSSFRQADRQGQVSFKQICGMIEKWFDLYSRDIIYFEQFRDAGCITEEQFISIVQGFDADSYWEEYDDEDVDGCERKYTFAWLGGCGWKRSGIDTMLPVNEIEEKLEKYNDSRDDDPDEVEAPQQGPVPDDAGFRLRGLFLPIAPVHTITPLPDDSEYQGGWQNHAQEQLGMYSDLYDIARMSRAAVYYRLKTLLRDRAIAAIRNLLQDYKEVCETLKVNRLQNDLHVIQREGIQIVGCTTTGLAKYRGLLATLMPRVMLIEEAAETREANIAAAMFPSLEQLILVGDHQQLTPHIDVRFLAKEPYNLQVSMFERLVKLRFPYQTLEVQRRMIPRIREVVQTFYPMLKDHPDVRDPAKRSPVPGMGGTNLWWFQHRWPESRGDSFSFANAKEADMIVNFVKYLLVHGVRPHHITVLTYYNAQVNLVKKLLREEQVVEIDALEHFVRTVDGFQGEENDIIILSLVRSPQDRLAAGFVEDENRAIVATSRAKCGMYVFGNAQNIIGSSDCSQQTWQKVLRAFGTQTGNFLPVTCNAHGDVTTIETVEDWENVSAGGCKNPCNGKCPNGHECLDQCHAKDQEHRTTCEGSCLRVLICGHRCVMLCNEPCQCSTRCNKTSSYKGKQASSPPSQPRAEQAAVKPPPYVQRTEQVAVKSPPPRHGMGQTPSKNLYRTRPHLTPARSPFPANKAPNTKGHWVELTAEEMMEIGYRNFTSQESYDAVALPQIKKLPVNPALLPSDGAARSAQATQATRASRKTHNVQATPPARATPPTRVTPPAQETRTTQAPRTLADLWTPAAIKQRHVELLQMEDAGRKARAAPAPLPKDVDDVFCSPNANAAKEQTDEEDLIDFGTDA